MGINNDEMKNLSGSKTSKKKTKPDVSQAVIMRLPRYYRYLRELMSAGKLRISSSELSTLMNVTSSQIRQDLNCFGGFGQQGYGYNVEKLYNSISEILGVRQNYNAVIIGAGNLGTALVKSPMFQKRGVNITGVFDSSKEKLGTDIDGLKIQDIETLGDFCENNRVDIAVLTIPKEYADEVASKIARYKINGIWNFTSKELDLSPSKIKVQNVHLGDSLMILCYELNYAD